MIYSPSSFGLIPNLKWPEKHIKSRKIDGADKVIFCGIGRSYKY